MAEDILNRFEFFELRKNLFESLGFFFPERLVCFQLKVTACKSEVFIHRKENEVFNFFI